MSSPFSRLALRQLFLHGGVLLRKVDSNTAQIFGAQATRQIKPNQRVRYA